MSKKNSGKMGNIMSFIALLFAVAAVCMIFVPSVTISVQVLGDTSYSGLNAVFGYTTENIDYAIFSFSFMNLLTYIFAIAAIVIILLKVFGVCKAKMFDYIAIALLAVSAVFFFLMPVFSISPYVTDLTKVLADAASIKLAIGAILGGVFAIVSALVMLVKNFMK